MLCDPERVGGRRDADSDSRRLEDGGGRGDLLGGGVGAEEDDVQVGHREGDRDEVERQDVLFAGERRADDLGAARFVAHGAPASAEELAQPFAGEVLVHDVDFALFPPRAERVKERHESLVDELDGAQLVPFAPHESGQRVSVEGLDELHPAGLVFRQRGGVGHQERALAGAGVRGRLADGQ